MVVFTSMTRWCSTDCRRRKVSLMVHELGHAACYRGGKGQAAYGSEEAADANVGRWGFAAELAALYEAAA